MERGETEISRMTVALPLQREKGSNALRFEVGVRRSLPLSIMDFYLPDLRRPIWVKRIGPDYIIQHCI